MHTYMNAQHHSPLYVQRQGYERNFQRADSGTLVDRDDVQGWRIVTTDSTPVILLFNCLGQWPSRLLVTSLGTLYLRAVTRRIIETLIPPPIEVTLIPSASSYRSATFPNTPPSTNTQLGPPTHKPLSIEFQSPVHIGSGKGVSETVGGTGDVWWFEGSSAFNDLGAHLYGGSFCFTLSQRKAPAPPASPLFGFPDV